MASILALKRRIKTAGNVSKTTKAMQMIAASKLKKAQDSAVLSRPYVEKLSNLSKNLSTKIENDNLHPYMKENQLENSLYIIISPDKGLSGSLVSNLLREVYQISKNKNDYFITIGKKAESGVFSLNKEVLATFPFGTSLPQFSVVYPIVKIINEYFLTGKISSVKIISTRFTSVFTQSPTIKTILPIKFEGESKNGNNVMLFEPAVSELLPSLLEHYLEMEIYQSLLENYASEQAARMVAMKNATDNATDIIKELKLEYNKIRQEKITNEILDIIGGQFAHA